MAHAIVVALAVPSVLERYGVGWDDEPPSRSRIIFGTGRLALDDSDPLLSRRIARCLSYTLQVAKAIMSQLFSASPTVLVTGATEGIG